MQIEICNYTLIFAIDVISTVLNHFSNRDFSCKYPGDITKYSNIGYCARMTFKINNPIDLDKTNIM